MKKILALLILVFSLASCGKDSGTEVPSEEIGSDMFQYTEDGVYKETGCKPKDAASIVKLWSIVDEQNNSRYLYGTKRKEENKECFWFSKYTSSGDLIWETILSDDSNKGIAWNPLFFNDGKILVNNIRYNIDYSQDYYMSNNDADIILLSSQDGSVIKKIDKSFFTDVIIFGNFFFTTIAQDELMKNQNLSLISYQISNDGNLLNQGNLYYPNSKIGSVQYKPTSPEGKTIWIGDTAYIHMDASKIERGNIFDSIRWTHPTNLPSLTNEADMNLTIEGDSINASYKLAEIDTTFRLALANGESAKKPNVPNNPFSFNISSFLSSSNEYYTGSIAFSITNNNDETIYISDIKIMDGNNNQISKIDESQLGIINNGENKSFSANLNAVYKPVLIIEYQYKGETKTFSYNLFL